MTRDEMIDLLKFASAFYEVNLSKRLIDAWLLTIGDMDSELAVYAFRECARHVRYPKLRAADVISAAKALTFEKSAAINAGDAWEIICSVKTNTSELEAEKIINKKCPLAYKALRQVYGKNAFRKLMLETIQQFHLGKGILTIDTKNCLKKRRLIKCLCLTRNKRNNRH